MDTPDGSTVPPGWRVIEGKLRTRFRTGDFLTGVSLTDAIAPVAEEMNHHPDIDLRYPHLDIALFTHDRDAITSLDTDLAMRITALAAERGVDPDPDAIAG